MASHVSHVHTITYHQGMTASDDRTSTPAYLSGGPTPPYRTSTPPTPPLQLAMPVVVRTWLEKTRDVLLCLACLCVLVTTGVVAYGVLALGQAASQVGDRLNDPGPAISCDPAYFNC